MRVLIVNKFLHANGGSETYIFKIGEELNRQGHEVEYFGMEHEKRLVGNRAESYVSKMDFHSSGFQKLTYPFKIIYSVEARKKIRLVLDDFKPDVIHLNNFNFQLTPSVIYEIKSWAKKNKKKVPIVFTAHDYQWVCPNHMMLVPKTKELCFRCQGGKFGHCAKNKCIHDSGIRSTLGAIEAKIYYFLRTYDKIDVIICPSMFMREKLATNPILKDKLITLYNFMDGNRKGQGSKKDYVLYFGRYSEEKGIKTLLEVCRNLPHVHFIFAGGGPLEEQLSECKNITNLGFLNGEQLKTIISEARFSVFPSEWYENCPFAVMESQWYGTPVIASAIGGVPELLQEGVTGELFEAGNVHELSSLIDKLWKDDELCRKYTDNCKSVAFDTVEDYCQKLLEIYQRLLSIKGE